MSEKKEEQMELSQAIGFYRGWAAARGMDDKLQAAIEDIVDAALHGEGNAEWHTDVLRHPKVIELIEEIADRDKEIIRLAKRAEHYELQANQLQKDKTELEENRKTWLPEGAPVEVVSGVPEPVDLRGYPHTCDDIEKPSQKGSVKEVIIDDLRHKRIGFQGLPVMHSQKPYCYRCEHLQKNEAGSYPLCTNYNVPIRAWQSERKCKAFSMAKQVVVKPNFKCSSCRNYDSDSKWCRLLDIYIKRAGENKYGMCPLWKSMFKEPVKLSNEMIKKGKEDNKK